MPDSTALHLIAGGIAGTCGAIVTCPLEVVKTRLQSSVATFGPTVCVSKVQYPHSHTMSVASFNSSSRGAMKETVITASKSQLKNISIYSCLRYIVQKEGSKALFKGLGPNVVGVAPSRAIYFCAYEQTKRLMNSESGKGTPRIHLLSAATAGFTAATLTNPLWLIKTRLQLDQSRHGVLTVRQCIKNIYRELGLRGFYKGITASYYGISETAIHFVIYEHLKQSMLAAHGSFVDGDRTAVNFIEFMGAAAVSKTTATCITYPHEVARTRLREPGNVYRHFWQTLSVVVKMDGPLGLYRGLLVHLLRQIPNTAVTMVTYELVVHFYWQYMLPSSSLSAPS